MALPRRIKKLVGGVLVVAMLLCTGLFVSRAWSLHRYAKEQTATYNLVVQLRDQRPENVDAEVWKIATSWAITAHGNVCFSESHVTIQELRRFRGDVEKRFAGNVDLATIDWLWQRLAETGPHGQQYCKRFEPQYREMLNEALANK